MIFVIIGSIVYFCISNIIIQNRVRTIQQSIVSSSVHLLSFVLTLAYVLPISPAFDIPKCSQLFVQVIADNDSESEILVFLTTVEAGSTNFMYVVDR